MSRTKHRRPSARKRPPAPDTDKQRRAALADEQFAKELREMLGEAAERVERARDRRPRIDVIATVRNRGGMGEGYTLTALHPVGDTPNAPIPEGTYHVTLRRIP